MSAIHKLTELTLGFFLSSIKQVTMGLDQLDDYMKSENAIRTFDYAFIHSMGSSFQNIQSDHPRKTARLAIRPDLFKLANLRHGGSPLID